MWCKSEPGNWPWAPEPEIYAQYTVDYYERCETCNEWSPYCNEELCSTERESLIDPSVIDPLICFYYTYDECLSDPFDFQRYCPVLCENDEFLNCFNDPYLGDATCEAYSEYCYAYYIFDPCWETCEMCGYVENDDADSIDLINSIRSEVGASPISKDEGLAEFAILAASRCDGGHWSIPLRTDKDGYDYVGITYIQGSAVTSTPGAISWW